MIVVGVNDEDYWEDDMRWVGGKVAKVLQADGGQEGFDGAIVCGINGLLCSRLNCICY